MDEKTNEQRVQFGMNNMFSKLTDVQILNLKNNLHQPVSYKKYSKEKILEYLKNPEQCAAQLRDASIYMYSISTQYRRVINYFAHMCPLNYIMYPFKFDPNKVKDKAFAAGYKKASDFLEILNLQHEMRKALVTAWREDIFAGYIYQTKDSLYIRKLNPDYIKIASIVDGCYMVAFDFAYFDSRQSELESYGEEFIEKYELYKKDTSGMKWQLLDEKRQFVIKISEDVMYPLIPLIGCLPGIYDIEDYKELSKGATILRNYKALGLKIPTDDKGDMLIDKTLADQFYTQLCNVTPSNIGVFQTPMEVEVYDFERSGAEDPDKTYEAIRNFYNDVGVSSLLFGGDKQNSGSLNISITADEALCFAVNRQIERNVNRLLKTVISGTIKFQITILDISIFHQQQFHDMLLKDAQYGVPVKSAIAASLGVSQPKMNAMIYMENDFLKLHEKMVPLQSSYTQSSEPDAEAGRPTAEELGEEVSDSNENTREHESNASR